MEDGRILLFVFEIIIKNGVCVSGMKVCEFRGWCFSILIVKGSEIVDVLNIFIVGCLCLFMMLIFVSVLKCFVWFLLILVFDCFLVLIIELNLRK